MYKSISTLFILALAKFASAGVKDTDFVGSGKIAVLATENWQYVSPIKDRVGCLNSHGKLIKNDGDEACGVFTRLDNFPYTLSTKEGNCTFEDQSQEKNTDSVYGTLDNAYNCNATYVSDIYDSMYTIVSLNHRAEIPSLTPTERVSLRLPLLRRRRLLLRREEGPRG